MLRKKSVFCRVGFCAGPSLTPLFEDFLVERFGSPAFNFGSSGYFNLTKMMETAPQIIQGHLLLPKHPIIFQGQFLLNGICQPVCCVRGVDDNTGLIAISDCV